jgi:hypothetical protein
LSRRTLWWQEYGTGTAEFLTSNLWLNKGRITAVCGYRWNFPSLPQQILDGTVVEDYYIAIGVSTSLWMELAMVLCGKIGFVALVGFVIVCVMCLSVQASPLRENKVRESLYEVFSHGMKVGQVKTVCGPVVRDRKKNFHFESSTSIDVHFLFFSYRLEKKEDAMIGDEGAYSYRRTMLENGKVVQVSGKVETGAFRFVIDEDGATRTLVIPREKYDYTTLDCPELTMGPDDKEKNLRILDLENLVIVSRKYHWVKDEDLDLAGCRVHCKVIDFQDLNKKGRRWVEGDDLGVLVLRQDGSGKGVSYSSRLASQVVRSVPVGR